MAGAAGLVECNLCGFPLGSLDVAVGEWITEKIRHKFVVSHCVANQSILIEDQSFLSCQKIPS